MLEDRSRIPESDGKANILGETGLTRAEFAYRELRQRIIDMRLPPGEPLDEESLMASLELGRTPLREAVKRLETDRLLVVYPRRGTFVAEVNIRDLGEISDARRVLEAFAARRAAERATGEDRGKLRSCLEALKQAPDGTNQTSIDLDAQIHRTIYATMRNSYVEATLIQYFALSQRMWNFVLAGLAPISGNVQEHVALLEAIIDGDPDKAARLAEEHVSHFEQLVQRSL
ncbi:GntR family transcriptional regulator [Zafaria cholistanensis]|uniref:GntR family transcriptional regulator n=1 Tax=Zafaria cholistanensis TaxID=1682741 RepID=A0A5A7NU89_9MICC|nr:GntR family transcriptional regulator [Zafaria cholistanensis]GER23341.1 GntR family transcriptional regulator [Zafaria cholistanensis]